MDHSTRADYSELERELSDALKNTGDEKVRQIRDYMIQMAVSSEQQVVVTSYPACNSDA